MVIFQWLDQSPQPFSTHAQRYLMMQTLTFAALKYTLWLENISSSAANAIVCTNEYLCLCIIVLKIWISWIRIARERETKDIYGTPCNVCKHYLQEIFGGLDTEHLMKFELLGECRQAFTVSHSHWHWHRRIRLVFYFNWIGHARLTHKFSLKNCRRFSTLLFTHTHFIYIYRRLDSWVELIAYQFS